MKRSDLAALVGLAALWGASFLFIRVAAPVLGPLVTIFLRVGIGALGLLAWLTINRIPLNIKTHWRAYLGMGVFNAMIPFTLFAIALLTLNASYTSILNATSAFFTALVAAVWAKEHLTAQKLLGIALGTIGVVALVGLDPVPLSLASIVAVLLVLLATFSYGIAAVFARRNNTGIAPAAFAAGQQITAAALMLPLAAYGLATQAKPPTIDVVGAVIGLGLFCTAAAYLLYFRLIVNIGPTRALTVTFLIPVFGILWGALLLREPITANMLIGFALIVVGMALVLGIVKRG
jgi:drug/metabolite transporter (DMT)-like permease